MATSQSTINKLALPSGILLITTAISPISQLTLAPVYGSLPSSQMHGFMIAITFSLGTLLHRFRGRASFWILRALPIWAAWIPLIQCLILPYSNALGPVYGPVVNGLLSCHTLLIPSAYALGRPMDGVELGVVDRLPEPFRLTVLALPLFLVMEKSVTSYITLLLSKVRWLTPVHLQMLLASCYSALYPSLLLLGTIPAILHAAFLNPHIDSLSLDSALQTHQWHLIDRAWSNTGYISILESRKAEYRVMRCDHSLLGGEWLLTDDRKTKEGWKVNEPVYAVFEMLEAVRLMEISPPIDDSSAHTLVIGLGIGTAPKAFLSHGIATTIVELDPIVHAFAKKYFALPSDHTAVIQDAVSYLNTAVSVPNPEQYDYFLHDVFTGGAEPLSLFTTSFLQNLRSLLKPHGVIAINYAGDLASPLTRLVLRTIAHVFHDPNSPNSSGGSCKLYRDSPPSKDSSPNEDADADFLNIIIFCRNSPGPITFRQPSEGDCLGSKSRQHYMRPKAELEIPFPVLRDADREVLGGKERLEVGDEGRFSKEQSESAKRHWRIMRRVMPDAVWELW